MTQPTPARTATRTPRRRREGVALIVAMLVLLMATATATYAVQNTSYELRSSGSAKKALQTKYAAESCVAVVMGVLEARQETNSLSNWLTTCQPASDMTERYYLPDVCTTGVDSYCFFDCASLAADPYVFTNPLPSGDFEATNGQRASAYSPQGEVMIEYHCEPLTATSGLLSVTASIFGRLDLPGAQDFRTCDDGNDATWGALEDRNEYHSSISISRGYYTVNVTSCDLF